MNVAMLVHGLGWAILHSLWKDALVGGATALALHRLRQAAPQRRYLVACVALLTCFLVPLVDAWRGMHAYAMAEQWLALSPMALASPSHDGALNLAQSLAPTLPWVVGTWGLGVAAMLLRLSLGIAWVRQLTRSGEDWRHTQWGQVVDRLAARMQVSGAVAVRVVAHLGSPMTVGWLRPVVLLPASLLTHMPVDLVEALLAHELAHIKRRDYLVNLLQSLVEALLFYHPVVWWLSKRIRVEREQVADDLAAQALGERRRLALALEALSLHEQHQTQLAQAANGGQLLSRIRQLVRPGRQTRGWRAALPLAGVLLASVVIHALSNPPEQTPTQAPTPPIAAPALDTEAIASLTAQLHASHVLVLDDDTGNVLLQKAPDDVVPIASISKLMTAMVVLDAKLNMQTPIRIRREDVDTLRHSYSKLPVGTTLPRGEIMKLALVASDNRAASALARSYPGGMPAFLTAAQRKISQLGLTHTTIEEPTGISYNNRSTAYDLAAMVRAASQYPDISRLSATSADKVDIRGKFVEYHNTNSLVGQSGWEVLVSKTGTSRPAGRCLVMRVKAADKHLTLVLLNADKPNERIEDAADILHQFVKPPLPQG